MSDSNMGFHSRGVSNGRERLLAETALAGCPLCERPFTDEEQAKRIHAKLDAQERALARQLEHDRLRLQAEAQKEGMERAQAATKEQIEGLVADNARLKDNIETAVREQTDARVAAERLQMEAKYANDAALRFQENEKLKRQVGQLTRALDDRKAYELGEGPELDVYRELRQGFPGDRITRVAKGVSGADVHQVFIEEGEECGLTILESKNRKDFKPDYARKLHADQLAAKADHAVLATCIFPPGTSQIAIFEGVILCNPARVVAVMRILRRFTIQASKLRKGDEGYDQKKAKLYSLFTSGEGPKRLKAVTADTERMRTLDTNEVEAHKRLWRARAKLYTSQEQNIGEIFAAIDRIIRGEDDGEAAF